MGEIELEKHCESLEKGLVWLINEYQRIRGENRELKKQINDLKDDRLENWVFKMS